MRQHASYGPWAVVAGASSGIGHALAVALAEAGLNLVLVARDRPRLEPLAVSLMARHAEQVRFIDVDLAREDHLAAIRHVTVPLDGGVLLASDPFHGMPWAAHDAATMAYVQRLAAAPGPTHTGFALPWRGRPRCCRARVSIMGTVMQGMAIR